MYVYLCEGQRSTAEGNACLHARQRTVENRCSSSWNELDVVVVVVLVVYLCVCLFVCLFAFSEERVRLSPSNFLGSCKVFRE